MAIRISGLNSGLDTDSIVQELVSAYNLKTEKYEKAKTKLEWKQDAWKGLNTKIYNLYTNISNLRYTSAYNMKKTTVSDTTKANVTSSSSAVIGTQRLQVLSTAQTAYLTSGKLKIEGSEGTKVTKDSTLADLGYKTTTKENIQIGDKSLEVTGSTKVSDVIAWLQKSEEEGGPNLNASFDEKNQRIFISAKESGTETDFNLTGNNEVLQALGLSTTITNSYGNFSSQDTQEEMVSEIEETINNYLNVDYLSQELQNDNNVPNEVKELIERLKNNSALNQEQEVAKLAEEIAKEIQENENIAYKVNGSNAKIRLNGALYESNSNDFSINGLNITVQGVTKAGEEVLISTSVDAQGIYDKIKDFLIEYNNVINEMTKLYNAESSKDYEPLTSDEKEAMSEEEIEKWEGKIKNALLRRDTTLSNVMSGMINIMSQSIVVGGEPVTGDDGKVKKDVYGNVQYREGTGTKFNLSSFGIQTLGFLNSVENEQNAYHIDGDEDDANTSGKTDKLMKAIQENADQVCEFMQRLATNLYSTIDTKMKSTTVSSAYKVYNDKEMDSQLKNYEKLISDWEEKVADKEDYYYKKFSAMETALSKLQSQTNSLSGLLGM